MHHCLLESIKVQNENTTRQKFKVEYLKVIVFSRNATNTFKNR